MSGQSDTPEGVLGTTAPRWQVIEGDCLEVMAAMEAESVQTCITSPPYWGLRDYGVEGQLGLEDTPAEYVSRMVEVPRGVWRVLRDDGTLWLNLGDSYAGSWGAQSRSDGNDIRGRPLRHVPASPDPSMRPGRQRTWGPSA